jgi:hypothetical protein
MNIVAIFYNSMRRIKWHENYPIWKLFWVIETKILIHIFFSIHKHTFSLIQWEDAEDFRVYYILFIVFRLFDNAIFIILLFLFIIFICFYSKFLLNRTTKERDRLGLRLKPKIKPKLKRLSRGKSLRLPRGTCSKNSLIFSIEYSQSHAHY